VNYLRNVWHGVLTPLGRPARFLIVDRIGTGNNLEEFTYPEPWTVTAA
jgi:ureidoglycolate lyase